MRDRKVLLAQTGVALFGERWQTSLGRALGFPDGRRVRQWLSEDRPLPDSLEADLTGLLKERQQLVGLALQELAGTKAPSSNSNSKG